MYHMMCLYCLVMGSKQTWNVFQAWRQKYETSGLKRYRLDQRQPSRKMHTYPEISSPEPSSVSTSSDIDRQDQLGFFSQSTHWKWYLWIDYYKMDIDHCVSPYTGRWWWCIVIWCRRTINCDSLSECSSDASGCRMWFLLIYWYITQTIIE
jgi:hypothetical protein